MVDVKNCPFCGGSPVFKFIRNRMDAYALVECSNCKAQSNRFVIRNYKSGDEDSDKFWGQPGFIAAVELWNKRV